MKTDHTGGRGICLRPFLCQLQQSHYIKSVRIEGIIHQPTLTLMLHRNDTTPALVGARHAVPLLPVPAHPHHHRHVPAQCALQPAPAREHGYAAAWPPHSIPCATGTSVKLHYTSRCIHGVCRSRRPTPRLIGITTLWMQPAQQSRYGPDQPA